MSHAPVLPRAALLAALAAAFLAPARPAQAGVVFTGSATNPEVGTVASGTAEFRVVGNTLTVVLTNTTSPRTAAQGNALTGVSFDVNGMHPTLSLTGITLTAGSQLWTSKTASTTSASLSGSWTDALGSSPLGDYGVATTGFGSRFAAGNITLGNGGPNYGIVAAGTFDGTNVAFSGSQFPFVQDSLTFTFTGASGLNESQISDVKLLFGTDGTGVVGATTGPSITAVPEPSSVMLGLSAAAGLSGFASWRRRRGAK